MSHFNNLAFTRRLAQSGMAEAQAVALAGALNGVLDQTRTHVIQRDRETDEAVIVRVEQVVEMIDKAMAFFVENSRIERRLLRLNLALIALAILTVVLARVF